MNLFGFQIIKSKDYRAVKGQVISLQRAISDIKTVIGSRSDPSAVEKKINEIIQERRKAVSRPLHYATPDVGKILGSDRKSVNHKYWGPGYDLSEIARAVDVEPYVNQSVRKHREQILKEGFSIQCDDQELTDYLYKRLFEMSLVSDVTTEQWVREFTTNLVSYGTTFLVKKRDANRSSGKSIRWHGKDLAPLAAVFPLDPTSVSVALNEYGHPVRWKQYIENSVEPEHEVTFENDDIIVATIDKKTGFVFGTPYILPTLDDVRTLRRLEELSELVAHRNAFPQVHYKVGTDDLPASIDDNGLDEVALVKNLVESLPTEGGLVTSHRVVAELLGGDKQTMDLVPLIEYFEKRVLGGLRLSEIDLGRGSNSKASAVTVSQGLQDSARDFQAIIADTLTHQLLLPLAFEGGFDIDPSENIPRFVFETINKEEQRSNQAHGADLYLGGAVTRTEYRKDYLGKKPCTEDEQCDLKPERDHEMAKELQQITGEQAIAKAKASKSATAVKNKVSNKSRPKNQHGRKSTKTAVTKNSQDLFEEYSRRLIPMLKDTKTTIWQIYSKHKTGVVSDDPTDLTTKEEQIKAAFDGLLALSESESRRILEPLLEKGAEAFMSDVELHGSHPIARKYIDRFFKNTIYKGLDKYIESAIELVYNNDGLAGIETEHPIIVYISGIFDQLENELNSICQRYLDLTFKTGYARAARGHGYKTIILSPDEDGWFCEECEEHGDIEVSLVDKNSSYSSLLTTHRDCDFVIRPGLK